MLIKKKIPRKQWGLCLVILFLAASILFTIFLFTDDSRKFHSFSKELFSSELSGDTLSLHYTLAYPEKYGFSSKAALPAYQAATPKDSAYIQSLLDRLSDISPERLSESDACTYELLVRYLTLQLSGIPFSYYAEPLSPSSGMQSSLPILLADYTFRSEQDVEDYLHLLDQTDTYFEQLISFEKEKAGQGLFMSDSAAAKIVEQCNSIMDTDLLSSKSHFLHTTFEERLNKLAETKDITEEQKAHWISENDRLLTTVMAPAYENLGDAFLVLSGSGQNPEGLAHYPMGQEYYEYLLASSTGSDRTIPEIKQMLFEDFQQNYTALATLVHMYPELAAISIQQVPELPFDSPEQMLMDLKNRMKEDFPPFPHTDKSFSPVCTVKNVSGAMEPYTSPAYYLTPPIDDLKNNIIYINQKNQPDSLSLYTTLAHEGYPGHLYQTVYSQLYLNAQKASPLRSILHYGGYVEGWALYVENLSYYYTQAIAADQPLKAAWYEACRLNRNLQLCMNSLLDIAIHYEGAGPEQVRRILQKAGITSKETAAAIFQYIVEEPANYLKYYLGFLEFQTLKEQAKDLWGTDYSDRRFHQFILETGPSDFRTLKNKMYAAAQDVILSAKAGYFLTSSSIMLSK